MDNAYWKTLKQEIERLRREEHQKSIRDLLEMTAPGYEPDEPNPETDTTETTQPNGEDE